MPLLTSLKGIFKKDSNSNSNSNKRNLIRRELPKDGRSSKDDTLAESLQKYNSFLGIIDPWVPVALLKVISKMTIMDSEFSKAVMNFQSIANTGHDILIEAPESKIIKALERLNTLARILNIDSRINDIIDQISRNGAGSIEPCINNSFTGVDKFVMVPPYSIRFLKIFGNWAPHQLLEHNLLNDTNNLLIPLNPITYRYEALQRLDNSPYGIPPFLAALTPKMMDQEIWAEFKRILKNMTLFGRTFAKIPPPPEQEPNETPEQFRQRYQEYICWIVDELAPTSTEGFTGLPNDLDLENFSVAQDLRGVNEVIDRVNRRLYSGLKSDPGLHGDHTNRTETFLSVIYKVLVHYSSNIRQIAKRMIEHVYNLDLLLGGIFIENERVSLSFNENSSLKPNIDGLAERYKVLNVKDKLNIGMVSPDRAAQELGYPEFYDEDLFRESLKQKSTSTEQYKVKLFKYSSKFNRYVLFRNSIDLGQYKTDEASEKKRAELSYDTIKGYIEPYLKEVLPYFDELKGDVVDYGVEYFRSNIEAISKDSEVFRQAIISYISNHPAYKNIEKESWFRKTAESHTMKAGQELLESDFAAFKGEKPGVKFVFGEGDRAAMKTYARVDHHFFSKFIDNKGFGGQIAEFTNKFLERGEALFGQWTKAVEKEFLRLFGNTIDGDIRVQMERIINTSMASIKTRTHIVQLNEVGFKYGRINGRKDTRCKICKPLHGKVIILSKAMKTVKEFETAASIQEALNVIKRSSITLKDLETDDVEDLLKNGKKIPTFHPNCWCFIEGDFDEKGE